MPESEEEKVKVDPNGIAAGIVAALVIIIGVLLAILLPGLYVKLWQWVY